MLQIYFHYNTAHIQRTKQRQKCKRTITFEEDRFYINNTNNTIVKKKKTFILKQHSMQPRLKSTPTSNQKQPHIKTIIFKLREGILQE